MSRLKLFTLITILKELKYPVQNMNIYPNTCSLQEDPKDLETGQVNLTFLDW